MTNVLPKHRRRWTAVEWIFYSSSATSVFLIGFIAGTVWR